MAHQEEDGDKLELTRGCALAMYVDGRYNDAEDLQVVVMKTRKRVLGEEHFDTLSSMADLATTYSTCVRHEEAEDLDAVVMKTRKRLLGEEHPGTLSSIGNLAVKSMRKGRRGGV